MPVLMYSVSEVVERTGLHRKVITKRCDHEKIGAQHASTGEWFLSEDDIRKLTHVTRPAGRPPTHNWELIDALLNQGKPIMEVAAAFNMRPQTIYNRQSRLKKRQAHEP